VPGNLPDLRRSDLPACRFAERCPRATERCRNEPPRLDPTAEHAVACWFPGEGVAAPASLPTEAAHG
jgi:oligopeptide/dipeptide ABC transporter ATP-binding protein